MHRGANELQAALAAIVGADRASTRLLDRVALANDASVYRLVPRAVVHARTVPEIQALLRLSADRGLPLTLRAAGTSLSGQAVTDGLLVVLSRHWRELRIEEDGRRVRVEPGTIGGVVNRHLQPYRAKIGPDPASINACMMGGILANNSSGMCCGVVHNAYHTLEALRFVLPDGTEVDSERPDADAELRRRRPDLVVGLLELKRRVESDPALLRRIRDKYRLKNTMGYSINALVDFASPVQMLAHLMIGSEGTLGFIAEAVLRTIPDDPFKYTGLLFFEDVPKACSAIVPLSESGAQALELMDRAALRSIAGQPGVPPAVRELPPGAASLLVEYQCPTEEERTRRREACDELLRRLPLIGRPAFTVDPAAAAALWRVRKGLIPSVGAMRARGTSFIIEDVVFPPERLAHGVAELQNLFAEHGYDDAILFGHAKDGNLHFVLTQAFQDPQDVERYDGFMRALAGLVAGRYAGALKAEHGTGRNMAPFVEREWGSAAAAVMRQVKTLIDPRGLLNPGVIFNPDPRAHVTHLKSLPRVEDEVDRCIECGFCESWCPSRDLTLTPRQRIVVRREMARLAASDPDSAELEALRRDYRYAGLDTCAADGLCALACPVAIDTGLLTKRLRREGHSAPAGELARLAAERFALVEGAARGALRLLELGRRLTGRRRPFALGPREIADLPRAATSLPATPRDGAAALYFPSCVSRILGQARDENGASLPRTIVEVARRGGSPVWIPAEVAGHCCGMPFSSKGYDRAYRLAVERTIDALWRWSEHGRLPIVTDTSPCALSLKEAESALDPIRRERWAALRFLDGIEFVRESLLPALAPKRLPGGVLLHAVCSVRKMGLVEELSAIARACAERAAVPVQAGCCGFAGDRGWRVPELTRAALRPAADEIGASGPPEGFSSSRTCELGLTRATGRPFRSFWYLLDRATR